MHQRATEGKLAPVELAFGVSPPSACCPTLGLELRNHHACRAQALELGRRYSSTLFNQHPAVLWRRLTTLPVMGHFSLGASRLAPPSMAMSSSICSSAASSPSPPVAVSSNPR